MSFPLAAKADVKGPSAHPFYKWAAAARPKDVPRWNFHKYLIGRDGYIAEYLRSELEPVLDDLLTTGRARRRVDRGAQAVEVWLRAHTTLVLLFLYLPIFSMIIFSFNNSRLVTVWDAANSPTFKWYTALLHDRQVLQAAWLSIRIAAMTATGAVILGKANLTEFANIIAIDMPSGYSSLGGQVKNPYSTSLLDDRGIPVVLPGGSSAGSAVAVAAGLRDRHGHPAGWWRNQDRVVRVLGGRQAVVLQRVGPGVGARIRFRRGKALQSPPVNLAR